LAAAGNVRRNDAYSALAQVSARRRRAGNGRRSRLRIPDGRLSPAAAVFVLLDAFVAVDALVAVERLLRAQLAQHALTLVAFVVIEQQLLVFLRRSQRRLVGFSSESERRRFIGPDFHEHAGRQLRLAVGQLLGR
jgi:hypothetical protein